MNKIWIIIQREYITRVRRKAFVITTLLAPLGFVLLLFSSVLISNYSQSRTDVAIIDDSGLFKDTPIADAEDQTVYFHKISDSYERLAEELPKEKIKKYQGIVYIPANFNITNPNNPQIAYRYVERPGGMKMQFINHRIGNMVQKLRMEKLKVSDEQIAQMQQEIKIRPDSLINTNENQAYTDTASIAGLVMGFAIYISLFFYGTMIMKGVMEEKTNRIVEVLTSSVKPFQLLMGKIVGIGAVGMTQFILWIILMFLVQLIAIPILGSHYSAHAGMTAVPAGAYDNDFGQMILRNLSALPIARIIFLFPFFFLGGFLLYGSLFAAVGAAMGEDGDQQSLMVPITVPIIISIFIAINVINNPDSKLGFWGSVIPFTSPVVMSALLPFRPAWWQIAISVISLITGFVLTTYIAGRIYRVGILMYGKKISLREMGKWIFSAG